MNDGCHRFKTPDSELVLRNGDIEYLRITEYFYRKLKDYLGSFLERHGRTFADLERVNYRDWFHRKVMLSFSPEQFMRFSERYEWDGGPGYWTLIGRDFAVVQFSFFDFTATRFAWLVGEEHSVHGIPHLGRNRFLEDLEEDDLVAEYAVVTPGEGEPFRISGRKFSRPTEALYWKMMHSASVAVRTDKGWSVLVPDGDHLVHSELLDDPEYESAAINVWGFFPEENEHHHAWLSRSRCVPDSKQVCDGILRAAEQMEDDDLVEPGRLFLYEHPDADCLIIFSETGRDNHGWKRIASYLQPQFGVFVHVFPISDYGHYFEKVGSLRCVYDPQSDGSDSLHPAFPPQER